MGRSASARLLVPARVAGAAAVLAVLGVAALPLRARGDETAPLPAPTTRPGSPTEPGSPAGPTSPAGAASPAESPSPAPTPPGASPPAPSAVDLRPTLEALGLVPRRQGARGTCSVFTMAGGIEAAIARAEGRGVRLSVEYLNWAANRAGGHQSDGQFFHSAWAGYARFGIAEESAMPYQARFDPKREPSDEARASAAALGRHRLELRWIKPNDGKKGATEAELAATREVLARGIPVCAGSYHSVLFVGYETDPASPGGGFFRLFDSGSGRAGTMSYEEAIGRLCDLCWVEVAGAPGGAEGAADRGAEPGPKR